MIPAVWVTKVSVPGLRWWIIGLVSIATIINFVDRLTIAILAPVITAHLGLTNLQFAAITTWFLIAYTASQGLSGSLYDRVGARRGFTFSILVWSVAEMAHAFARGMASLSYLRVLLGLGEAGSWPGSAKVIAEWFPVRERALAMAIFNSGVTVGSIVAPPLVVWLQLRFGWQMTFLTTGALGFGWLLLWLLFYETPERHVAVTPKEHALIQQGKEPSKCVRNIRWRDLLTHRQVWAIVLSRFFTDPVWWLYITWLPLYLYDVRGFSLKQIGMFAWVPYVAAGAGSLTGGWLSGCLIGRGWTVNKGRKAVIVIGMLLMLSGILAATAKNAMTALAFIGIVMFGFQSWINNVQTLPSDYFPEGAVASVAGLGGVGAGLGAILLTLTTGLVLDRSHSYTPILVMGALLPVLGTTVLFVFGGAILPLSFDQKKSALIDMDNERT